MKSHASSMTSTLAKISTWKLILPVFLLFAIFSFMLFPRYQSSMSEYASEDVVVLDTRFSYGVEDVRNLFDKLGPEGRDVYRIVVGRIDMLYPPVYGIMFTLVLAWLLKKTFGTGSRWMHVAWLPLLGAAFDYLENFNTLTLLDDYPELSSATVARGASMTLLKHVTGIISMGLCLVFGVVLLLRRITGRKVARTRT